MFDIFKSSQEAINAAVKEVNARLLTGESYTSEQARDDLLQMLGLPPMRPNHEKIDWRDI